MRKVVSPVTGTKKSFLMVLGQLATQLEKDEIRSVPPTINKTELQMDQGSE